MTPAAHPAATTAKPIQSSRPNLRVLFSSVSASFALSVFIPVLVCVSVFFPADSVCVVSVVSVRLLPIVILPVVTDFIPPSAFGGFVAVPLSAGCSLVGSAVVSVFPSAYSVFVNSITTFVRSFVSVSVVVSVSRLSSSWLSVSCVVMVLSCVADFAVFRVELQPDNNIGQINNVIYIHFILVIYP